MRKLNRENLLKLKSAANHYGLRDFWYKVREKLSAPYQDYPQTAGKYLPSQEELDNQRVQWKEFKRQSLVSIVVPTYETEEGFLRQMVDSVAAQTYPRWQLCIADGSGSDRVERTLRERYADEARISYCRLDHNGGISENTNRGLEMAAGEYIVLLDHDDTLTPNALYEMVKAVNETGAEMVYSDEDQMSENASQYMNPHFKPDFNRELLLGNNYICHLLMVSPRVAKLAGGMDSRCDGAQDFDFVLRCSRLVSYVHHVPKILYHWRVHPGSTAGNADSKQYVREAGRLAVEKYLQAEGWSGKVEPTGDLGFFRIAYDVPRGVAVTVREWGEPSSVYRKIRRQAEQEFAELGVKAVWGSGQQELAYSGIVDSGRTDKAIEAERASATGADYILTLNRSVCKMAPGSIGRLLGSCAREGIAEVGAKSILHGNVVQCGYREEDGGLTPRFRGLPQHFRGYMKRAWVAAEVDAVGSDLTIKKNRSRAAGAVGGVDAGNSGGTGRIVVEPAAVVWLSGGGTINQDGV